MDTDKFQICFNKGCEKYGACALYEEDISLDKIPIDRLPRCRFFYLNRIGVDFKDNDGKILSKEELWNLTANEFEIE